MDRNRYEEEPDRSSEGKKNGKIIYWRINLHKFTFLWWWKDFYVTYRRKKRSVKNCKKIRQIKMHTHIRWSDRWSAAWSAECIAATKESLAWWMLINLILWHFFRIIVIVMAVVHFTTIQIEKSQARKMLGILLHDERIVTGFSAHWLMVQHMCRYMCLLCVFFYFVVDSSFFRCNSFILISNGSRSSLLRKALITMLRVWLLFFFTFCSFFACCLHRVLSYRFVQALINMMFMLRSSWVLLLLKLHDKQ